jgi:hypothetical protein
MVIRGYTVEIKMGKQCEEGMNTSSASKLSIACY